MARLAFLLFLLITVLMPRRYYTRYVQVFAVVAVLAIALGVVAYLDNPNDAGLQDMYIMIGFTGMNAAVVFIKYFLLRSMPPKPRLPQ